jgi:hypothetical protein
MWKTTLTQEFCSEMEQVAGKEGREEREREREPGASGSHLIILTTQQTEIWRIMV